MRSVFTVEIPAISGDKYPSNADFLNRLRMLGWEDMKIKDMADDEKARIYQEKAEELWKFMPEVATHTEKDYVVFYGILLDNQTKFVVTRLNESQATFRLLHVKLDKLQSSTDTIIRKLLKTYGNEPVLKVSNNAIAIYEKGDAEVIIDGRVIIDPFWEAVRTDRKNMLLTVFGFVLTVPSLLSLLLVSSTTNRILGGTLERLSTAFLSTTVVSAIGFLQTYLQVKSIKLIDWDVASIEKR
jgi:hypothetical protein